MLPFVKDIFVANVNDDDDDFGNDGRVDDKNNNNIENDDWIWKPFLEGIT